MNTNIQSKVNRFGKVGKIAVTALLVASIAVALLTCAAAVYTATLPKNAVKVTVTNNAEFKIDKKSFATIWGMLSNNASYSTDKDPLSMFTDDGEKISPAENTEIKTDLSFFNQSYSSATVRTEGNEKIIDAKSSPAEYRLSDLVTVLVFATLCVASVAFALFMLERLFKVLSVCESPFCTDFVDKLKKFGFALLPVAVFSSIGETLAVRFLTAGNGAAVSVQWGVLLAFAVTMCLVTVFRYGAMLQKESDETL